jgi:hypothetical protein
MNDSRHPTKRRILVVANESAEGGAETRSHWLGRRLHLLVDPSRHAVGTAR